MSSACQTCGYRDTEVKSGGAIADKARKITLKVESEEDLKRDIRPPQALICLEAARCCRSNSHLTQLCSMLPLFR